ncbi:hypothetical protein ACHWQZ_G013854 [Mnemiopsis leidyi]
MIRTIRLFLTLAFILCSLFIELRSQEVENPSSPTLYISTLDGTFYALDTASGTLKWKIKEDKVVSVPNAFQENQKFFPDPLDGSLYIVNRGNIEKLQHTIPEMVNNSPMRTRSGLLYAGKKTDYWVALNPASGDKHSSVTTAGIETCTAVAQEDAESNLYVGKTEYSLTIVDSKTSTQTWNVTYVSYAAPKLTDHNYEYTHYASSSDGTLLTFQTDTNNLLWHTKLVSPVISVFIQRFGSLLRVPHRTLAADTIVSYLIRDIRDLISDEQKNVANTLFIGKYDGGIYAMNEVMHAHALQRPRYPSIGQLDEEVTMIGRHVLPIMPEHLLISHVADDSTKNTKITDTKIPETQVKEDPVQTYLVIAVGIIVVLVVVVFVVMIFMLAMIKNLKDTSSSAKTEGSETKTSKHSFTVGKIEVYLSDIIGHGSEGTVVFKGRFEKRDVAVKRVLIDFIDIDEREVELLRQADEHPNVIRYFCMETDSMFRYLALEMCQASLREYVENTIFAKNNAQNKSLLFQTISGLKHLHSLNIVHRDIKPGNVLITKCTKRSNTLKALISDFGLCRKISEGRQSLTARTGSAGTDGWIAPEMLLPSTRISCAVDIFSYGCIMYYVLSGGQHPFGNDVYRRQNNILNYDYDLSSLSEATQDNVLAVSLIVNMVGTQDKRSRPTSEAIAMHPYFWDAGKQLRFYSDVSDRVEKEENSELVLRWEHNCVGTVLRGGWMNLCPEIENDLYKYRKYKSDSVRDLLRAMRNKRHHYRELPEDLKTTLGDIPDGYMNYFSVRFPRLLLHTYTIMRDCQIESVFKQYYPDIGTFEEQRMEMPHYETEARCSTSPCRLALDSEGQYSKQEVIKPAVPSFLSHCEPSPTNKKKPNKNNQNKQRVKPPASSQEVLSWRRNSYRSNSESSDGSHHRSLDFKPESDKTRKHKKSDRNREDSESKVSNKSKTVNQDRQQYQIRTINKFELIADESDETEQVDSVLTSEAPADGRPWFEKFELSKQNQVVRRKKGANES